jgi:hypothetical protein
MKYLVSFAALIAFLVAGVQSATAAELDRADFRYARTLAANSSDTALVRVEPDGALFEHSSPAFTDLRVVDADGHAVPWRHAPSARAAASEAVPVLNSGRQGHTAVALLDLGAQRRARDRVVLDIPDRDFVGRAVVLGADGRDVPFTRLSTTGVYDVGGAQPARSTVAVFPPSDYRYLLVRVSGVSRIAGARVSGARERPRLLRRTIKSTKQGEDGERTVVTLDLGFRNLPVDELRIAADTERYERPVMILGSNDGMRFAPLAAARIFRFAGSSSAPIPIGAHDRYIRIEVDNGDDPPLRDIEVSAWSQSRALLLEGGHPSPFTVYYGNTSVNSPDYDFARLPASAVEGGRTASGHLGPERENPSFEPPPDTRSFAARNPGLITGALVLAAVALGAVGLLALRKRA